MGLGFIVVVLLKIAKTWIKNDNGQEELGENDTFLLICEIFYVCVLSVPFVVPYIPPTSFYSLGNIKD